MPTTANMLRAHVLLGNISAPAWLLEAFAHGVVNLIFSVKVHASFPSVMAVDTV